MRQTHAVIAVLGSALLLAGGITVANTTVHNAAIGPSPCSQEYVDVACESVHWRTQLQEHDTLTVYRAFVAHNRARDASARHLQAHAFGGALYETSRFAHFALCADDSMAAFEFGCLHELLSRAIEAEGMQAVHTLNELCFTTFPVAWPMCQHGLGHGLIASSGYQLDDLKTALAMCDDLRGGAAGGCYGGVFMEYDLRLFQGDARETRALTDAGLAHPCGELAPQHRNACYSRLPQWWLHLPPTDDFSNPKYTQDKRFTIAGERCRALATSADERTACMRGIGRVAVLDSDTLAGAPALCRAAAENHADTFACLQLVGWWVTHVGDGDARIVCEHYTGKDRAACERAVVAEGGYCLRPGVTDV